MIICINDKVNILRKTDSSGKNQELPIISLVPVPSCFAAHYLQRREQLLTNRQCVHTTSPSFLKLSEITSYSSPQRYTAEPVSANGMDFEWAVASLIFFSLLSISITLSASPSFLPLKSILWMKNYWTQDLRSLSLELEGEHKRYDCS